MSGIAWTKASQEFLPHIVTRRTIIQGVLKRWMAQYPRDKAADNHQRITDQLEQLDFTTCDRDTIDKIIGNESWTRLECDVCGMDRDEVVSIPRQYESAIDICRECGEGVLSVFTGVSA